jgi:hypothetical protein
MYMLDYQGKGCRVQILTYIHFFLAIVVVVVGVAGGVLIHTE